MSLRATPVMLCLADDGSWLESAGLPCTDAQIATLQAYLDADDLAARADFHRTVFGKEPTAGLVRQSSRGLSVIVTRIRALQAMEVNAVKLANAHPQILTLSESLIATKVRELQSLDLDPTKVISLSPSILDLDPVNILETMAFLDELGADPVVIGNGAPQALGFSQRLIAERFAVLQDLGVDPVAVFERYPPAITYGADKVRLTAAICQQVGIWDRIRDAWNAGDQLGLLSTPVDSLALMAGEDPVAFAEVPTRAKRYPAARGWKTRSERRTALAERLDPDARTEHANFVRNLGPTVVTMLVGDSARGAAVTRN